jgi:hypothetical protein
MRPVQLTLSPANVDADGVCASQTPGGAGNLLLNGALVVDGVAVLAPSGQERQALFTFAADETGKNFVIVGTNAFGGTITETVAGGVGTAVSTKYYFTIVSITISAASVGALTVGTNGVTATQPCILDYRLNPFTVGLAVNVTGTINYTVEYCLTDIFASSAAYSSAVWFPHSVLATQTGNKDSNIASPVFAVRVKTNSYTNGATAVLSILQGGW